MALFDEVYNYIENNYKANEPIFLSELNISGICSPANEKANRRWTIKTF